jgi:hypothetical protein
LFAACHSAANPPDSGDCSASVGSVSHTAIVSYVRRP